MRALVFLLLGFGSAAAAPVPKELRRAPLPGTWELMGTNLWGTDTPEYNGQRWRFGPDGTFTISERLPAGGYAKPRLHGSYKIVAAGTDILFGSVGVPAQSLTECAGPTLKLANTKKNEMRPGDFRPHADSVIYTFKRVEE